MPPRFSRSRRSACRRAVHARASCIRSHIRSRMLSIRRDRSMLAARAFRRTFATASIPFPQPCSSPVPRRRVSKGRVSMEPACSDGCVRQPSGLDSNQSVSPSTLGMPPWRRQWAWGAHSETFLTRVGGHGRGLERRPPCCLDMTSPLSDVALLVAAYRASGRPFTLGSP